MKLRMLILTEMKQGNLLKWNSLLENLYVSLLTVFFVDKVYTGIYNTVKVNAEKYLRASRELSRQQIMAGSDSGTKNATK